MVLHVLILRLCFCAFPCSCSKDPPYFNTSQSCFLFEVVSLSSTYSKPGVEYVVRWDFLGHLNTLAFMRPYLKTFYFKWIICDVFLKYKTVFY